MTRLDVLLQMDYLENYTLCKELISKKTKMTR